MKPVAKRTISAPPRMRLLPSPPAGLIFGGSDKRRSSPYLEMLQRLLQNPGTAIEADSPNARASFIVQAKKHKISILFAESGGKLYVKLADSAGPVQVVQRLLADGPKTISEISLALAAAGHGDEIPGDVMKTLSASSLAILRDVAGVRKWCAMTPEPLTTLHTGDGNAVTIRGKK